MKIIPTELVTPLTTLVNMSIPSYETMAKMSDKEMANFLAFAQNNQFVRDAIESKSFEDAIADVKVRELISNVKLSAGKMLEDLMLIKAVLDSED